MNDASTPSSTKTMSVALVRFILLNHCAISLKKGEKIFMVKEQKQLSTVE